MSGRHESDDDLWRYNAEDCVRTFEISEVLDQTIKDLSLAEVNQFQQDLFWPVLKAMNRGVRIDLRAREKMAMELMNALADREALFFNLLGFELNPQSPKQMMALFYDDLKQQRIISRKTGNPTCDDEALTRIATKEPLLAPLIRAINEYRSLGVFLSTFVKAPLDNDQRIRCSYNICGTETYRFSSSKNAFGGGTNLQNLPKGNEEESHTENLGLRLPNIRKLFIPDPGNLFFDMDLDRADLQVVVAEANDGELKAALREGVDIHSVNAKTLGISRQLAKSWVHGTNYGGGPRTMAINCGITVRDAENMQRRWFAAHPGIERWHRRVEADLRSKRTVENKFGYRRYYFDRIEGILPEALAWIPQSTVACVINRIWMNIFRRHPEVEVLLQVHDSLAGQIPFDRAPELLTGMLECAKVVVPYADPLIIPASIKVSAKSWGDCNAEEFSRLVDRVRPVCGVQ